MLSIYYNPCSGQKNHIHDSLLNRLNEAFESDSLHAIAYEDVIWSYMELADSQKIWSYLDSLRSFGIRADYPYAELLYEFNVAYFYFRRSRYDSAIIHMQETARLADVLGYPKQKINACFRLASIYKLQGEIDSSLAYVEVASQIAHRIQVPKLMIDVLNMRAGIEQERGNYLVSLENFLEADSLYRLMPSGAELKTGNNLMNIAIMLHEQLQNDEKALDYLEAAKESYRQQPISSTHSLASADLVLAEIRRSLGDLSIADSLLQSALAYFRSVGHPEQTARAAMLQGRIKGELNENGVAEELLLEAMQLYEQLRNPQQLSIAHHYLGQLYGEKKDYDRSTRHLKRAIGLTSLADHRVQLLRELAYVLAGNGSVGEGFDSLKMSLVLSDSLNSVQLAESLQDAETKYQTAQKEKEIGALLLVRSQEAVRNQRILFIGGLGLVALLAIALFYFYRARQRNKVNRQLKELDVLKSKLFSDISHEFRTPLSLIRGPLEMLSQRLQDRPEIQQELSIVHRNATRLNRLVDSVQNLAKLDAGRMQLHIRPTNFREHLKIIGASFESMAMSKNLAFELNLMQNDHDQYYDPKHVETILYNLLSNAFKFTRSGEIRLEAKILDDHASIKVSDTGLGLSEAQQQKIFERYFRVENDEASVEGVGIGLSLAYELAKLHHGELQVESTRQQGSIFTLSIPINKEYYTQHGLEIGPTFLPSTKMRLESTELPTSLALINQDEPVMLLVEDNSDMLQHLTSIFEDEYAIICASNGEVGLEKAQQYIPDIIISDLMMPVMDGQALLSAIKGDEKTSHIPFIMLTANHLEREKIKGLKLRVDEYMTKPFSIEEVRLKVDNIVFLREQLRLKYQATRIDEKPTIQLSNETEERFWTQLKEVVQSNLDNTAFSADDFAKAMFMSRMQLHRKLKAMTNMSATIFLRTERLREARSLLQRPDAIVSNVAYEVGFSSPSFFSKCFKEQYGMTPKEAQSVS